MWLWVEVVEYVFYFCMDELMMCSLMELLVVEWFDYVCDMYIMVNISID